MPVRAALGVVRGRSSSEKARGGEDVTDGPGRPREATERQGEAKGGEHPRGEGLGRIPGESKAPVRVQGTHRKSTGEAGGEHGESKGENLEADFGDAYLNRPSFVRGPSRPRRKNIHLSGAETMKYSGASRVP